MDDRELTKRLDELKLEVAKARAQAAIGGAPQNAGRIKEIRKTIARALTVKREREIAKIAPKPKQASPKEKRGA